MNSYNDTNRKNKIEAAVLAAGAIVALTSLLPMTAQAAQSKTKHTRHTAAVHHTTRRHITRRVASAVPKKIVIHGYASTHPYSRQWDSQGSYINVSVGRTASVSSSEMPARRWYPEGHSGPGGVIMLDGSLVPNAPDVSISATPPVPDYGSAPGIIQYPPYSGVGLDNYGGFGDFGAFGGYGGVIPTVPVVAAPVAPVAPVVPVTPAVTPVVP